MQATEAAWNAGAPMAHPASSRSPAPGTRFERGKLAEHDPIPEATQAADDTPVGHRRLESTRQQRRAMIFTHKS